MNGLFPHAVSDFKVYLRPLTCFLLNYSERNVFYQD